VRVRIGISDSREVELDVDDDQAFKADVETAFSEGSSRVLWVTDAKGRAVGIPVEKIAYVEMETSEDRPNVGFSADLG
jgi:hypothetical protein